MSENLRVAIMSDGLTKAGFLAALDTSSAEERRGIADQLFVWAIAGTWPIDGKAKPLSVQAALWMHRAVLDRSEMAGGRRRAAVSVHGASA